jgi:hypothetical protein
MHGASAADQAGLGAPRSESFSGQPAATVQRRGSPRRVLWIGDVDGDELSIARESIQRIADCTVIRPSSADDADDDAGSAPDCVLLVADRPGRWNAEQALAIRRRWPLAPIFAIATSLGDGRRRSGPPLPGIEEIPWHDAPGRLACWFADLDAGLPGSLGLASTVRREDRLLDAPAFQPRPRFRTLLPPVTLSARTTVELDGLADLVIAAGHPVEARSIGRPELAPPSRLVVWDACRLESADLEWLRLLVANRPGVAVVILDSFPRGDSCRAALQAGAAAVLGRPVSLEALVGTLRGLSPRAAAV